MSYLQTSFHNIILSVLIGFEVWIPTSNYPHSRGVNNWHSNWNYPLVNKYSNGISPCSIGNTSSEGLLSIAMITYQSVPLSASPSNYCFMDNHGSKSRCASVRIHMIACEKKALWRVRAWEKSLWRSRFCWKVFNMLDALKRVYTAWNVKNPSPTGQSEDQIFWINVCWKSKKLINLTGKCATGFTATVIYIPYQSTACSLKKKTSSHTAQKKHHPSMTGLPVKRVKKKHPSVNTWSSPNSP